MIFGRDIESEGLGFKPYSRSVFIIELTQNSLNVGRKNMLFQWRKKLTTEIDTFESFPAELSLITEEKRLIKVAVLHLQSNHVEGAGNFFVFLFSFWEARDLK